MSDAWPSKSYGVDLKANRETDSTYFMNPVMLISALGFSIPATS
jgi:hypothetical protein